MKILILALLVISNLFISLPAQPNEFSSKEGRFVINFPGKPELTEAPLDVTGIKGQIHNYSLTTETISYTVAYTDYTTIDPKLLSDEKVFIYGASNGFINLIKGELRGGINTSFNDYPGRSLKIYFNDRIAFTRFYLVERRMYQLLVIIEKKLEDENVDQITRFFDSFQLIDSKGQITNNKNNDLKSAFDPSAPTKKRSRPTNTRPTDPEIYTNVPDIKLPIIVEKYKPRYTENAKQKWVEGVVVLSAVFRKNHELTDIVVVSSLGEDLDEEAVIAAKKIKFTPGQKDGQDISYRARLEFTFKLF